MEIFEKARSFLRSRSRAYSLTFSPENQAARIVLEDLAKFCRANDSTFHADERIHAALEGRREVWLRICHHIKLNPDQLWKVYGRKDIE